MSLGVRRHDASGLPAEPTNSECQVRVHGGRYLTHNSELFSVLPHFSAAEPEKDLNKAITKWHFSIVRSHWPRNRIGN